MESVLRGGRRRTRSRKQQEVKHRRLVDESLLKVVRGLSCIGCGYEGPNHPHHVTSRKAGGDDVATNLMPLCAVCHSKLHQYGYSKAMRLMPGIRIWLELAEREDVLRRSENSAR